MVDQTHAALDPAMVDALTKELTDKGLLIEAGFVSLRHAAGFKTTIGWEGDQ